MTCGAGQAALKTSGLAPRDGVVLAGPGPLVSLLAWQYLRAGVPITTLLDTTPAENRTKAARLAPSFLRSRYAREGAALVWSVRRKVRVIRGVTELRAEGEDHVRAVVYRRGREREQRIATKHPPYIKG